MAQAQSDISLRGRKAVGWRKRNPTDPRRSESMPSYTLRTPYFYPTPANGMGNPRLRYVPVRCGFSPGLQPRLQNTRSSCRMVPTRPSSWSYWLPRTEIVKVFGVRRQREIQFTTRLQEYLHNLVAWEPVGNNIFNSSSAGLGLKMLAYIHPLRITDQ